MRQPSTLLGPHARGELKDRKMSHYAKQSHNGLVGVDTGIDYSVERAHYDDATLEPANVNDGSNLDLIDEMANIPMAAHTRLGLARRKLSQAAADLRALSRIASRYHTYTWTVVEGVESET